MSSFFSIFILLSASISWAQPTALASDKKTEFTRFFEEPLNFDMNWVVTEINDQLRVGDSESPRVKLEVILSRLPLAQREQLRSDLEDMGLTEDDIAGLEWVVSENPDDEVALQLIYNNGVQHGSDPLGDKGRVYLQIYGGFQSTQSMLAMLSGENYKNMEYAGVTGLEVRKRVSDSLFGSRWGLDLGVNAVKYLEPKRDNGNRHSYAVFVSFIRKTLILGFDVKLALSEGISYAPEGGSHFEEQSLRNGSDGRVSKLLNYIGLEATTPVCGLFKKCKNRNLGSVGVKLLHRSGGFQLFDMFNNTKGGSNYLTLVYEYKVGR